MRPSFLWFPQQASPNRGGGICAANDGGVKNCSRSKHKPYVIAVVTSTNPSVAFSDSSPFRGAYIVILFRFDEEKSSWKSK